MNERIKLLADKALDKAVPYTWTTLSYDEVTKLQEKFAELIVRETIMQMAVQMNKFGDDQANNPAWYKSEDAVKQYFGVEE